MIRSLSTAARRFPEGELSRQPDSETALPAIYYREGVVMLEVILGIGVCIVMARIASADDQSAFVWFFVTFGLCLGALYIPIPFFRFLFAGVLAFAAMIGYKAYASR